MDKRYLLKIGKCYLKRDVDVRQVLNFQEPKDWVVSGNCKITPLIEEAYMFSNSIVPKKLVDHIGGKVVEVTFKVKNA